MSLQIATDVLTSDSLIKELRANSTKEREEAAKRYFKTGKGEYGYGDLFLGTPVPAQRQLAKKYSGIPFTELKKLLTSEFHECRLTALFIMVNGYKKAKEEKQKEKFVQLYLQNKKHINNWDLVDSSAPHILGNFLMNKPRKILYELAKSDNIWDRRIAIMSTQYFIAQNQFEDTLKLSRILLNDQHDLIHKAVGWMLREVGDRSPKTEKQFLEHYATSMPRTMLRYAIEKFPEKERASFLKKK